MFSCQCKKMEFCVAGHLTQKRKGIFTKPTAAPLIILFGAKLEAATASKSCKRWTLAEKKKQLNFCAGVEPVTRAVWRSTITSFTIAVQSHLSCKTSAASGLRLTSATV